jgi:hypothetical protein
MLTFGFSLIHQPRIIMRSNRVGPTTPVYTRRSALFKVNARLPEHPAFFGGHIVAHPDVQDLITSVDHVQHLRSYEVFAACQYHDTSIICRFT